MHILGTVGHWSSVQCARRLFRNQEELEKLSELGVLFLLFEMGLELSLDRLKVGCTPRHFSTFRHGGVCPHRHTHCVGSSNTPGICKAGTVHAYRGEDISTLLDTGVVRQLLECRLWQSMRLDLVL